MYVNVFYTGIKSIRFLGLWLYYELDWDYHIRLSWVILIHFLRKLTRPSDKHLPCTFSQSCSLWICHSSPSNSTCCKIGCSMAVPDSKQFPGCSHNRVGSNWESCVNWAKNVVHILLHWNEIFFAPFQTEKYCLKLSF